VDGLGVHTPLCCLGRVAKLGEVEASVLKHVAAQMIFLGGSCEFASRPIRMRDRGLPRRGSTAGVAFFRFLFLARQEKELAAGQPPA
jgi:hypothetical protein